MQINPVDSSIGTVILSKGADGTIVNPPHAEMNAPRGPRKPATESQMYRGMPYQGINPSRCIQIQYMMSS
jgi:hypothetical protein